MFQFLQPRCLQQAAHPTSHVICHITQGMDLKEAGDQGPGGLMRQKKFGDNVENSPKFLAQVLGPRKSHRHTEVARLRKTT